MPSGWVQLTFFHCAFLSGSGCGGADECGGRYRLHYGDSRLETRTSRAHISEQPRDTSACSGYGRGSSGSPFSAEMLASKLDTAECGLFALVPSTSSLGACRTRCAGVFSGGVIFQEPLNVGKKRKKEKKRKKKARGKIKRKKGKRTALRGQVGPAPPTSLEED